MLRHAIGDAVPYGGIVRRALDSPAACLPDVRWKSTRPPLSARHEAVVGRKNQYVPKSRRGTQLAATLYTILETLKLHLDPTRSSSLRIEAADRGEVLLPWHFAAPS